MFTAKDNAALGTLVIGLFRPRPGEEKSPETVADEAASFVQLMTKLIADVIVDQMPAAPDAESIKKSLLTDDDFIEAVCGQLNLEIVDNEEAEEDNQVTDAPAATADPVTLDLAAAASSAVVEKPAEVVESAEAAEPVQDAPAAEVTTETAESELTASAESDDNDGLDIMTLAKISADSEAARKAEWQSKKNTATNAIFDALNNRKLRIDGGAEYVNQDRDICRKAMHHLMVEVAAERMTVEEAISFAIEQGWTYEVLVSPAIHRQMLDGFGNAGLFLRRTAFVEGNEIDIQTELGKALEEGKHTLDEIVDMARNAGWTNPFDTDRGGFTNIIGEAIRAKDEGEREAKETSAKPNGKHIKQNKRRR